MANVRVAVRVRPLSKREIKEGGRIIVEVDGKMAKIRNLKVDSRSDGFGDFREKVVAFGFDYCYWSVNPEDPQYSSQDVVFQDLGTEVLSGAAQGYNICLFAYGQTGSGKTYTMLGTPASVGLTPRICEGLFIRQEDYASLPSSCRIKVSFLEIYNERVRDLLKQSDQKKSYTLRVREHPEMGPYVQGLSQHVVSNYKQVIQLLEEGIANRITAATHVHEASSRSHIIFTIHYTQAVLENSLHSEITSKINLVDLAGSERADPSYCKDRITEGANINKSLVTLGIVISTLAQNSQVFSCQSFNSVTTNGGNSGIPSSSGTSSGGGPSRRQLYIPYRDSVLTWLLKDSLGGNSKTIMVATVSPAHTSYSETMSTLRYASNAKNIINKPRVNEDANVKLIRELREEIRRLKAMLLSFELRNFNSLNEEKDGNLKELVLQNEFKIDQLTKDWTQKWNEWKTLLEHCRVDINRRKARVVIDSSLPHLMALEDDVLSTGVVLYYLKEGITKIGRIDSEQEQDIVLQGQWIERDHCTITSTCGVVILRPAQGAHCTVNGREVTASCRLTQGAVITLGKAQKFRFNHPAEAAVLRQRRQIGEAVGDSGSLEWLNLDGDVTTSRLGPCPLLWKKRIVLGEQSDKDHRLPRAGETRHRAQIQQQQCYVGDLRQQILAGQIRAKQDLEFDQAHVTWQIKDNQRWLLREETWLASLQQQQQQQQQQDCVTEKELEASVPTDAWLQTDPKTQLSSLVRSRKRVVPPQLLRRRALRVAKRNVQRKKVLFQLERIVKKQRLLKALTRLEQLKELCWLQDDCPQEPSYQVTNPDAMVPGCQCSSQSTSCSSLSLQRLCLRYLPQLCSVFLHQNPSTMFSPMYYCIDQTSEKTQSGEHLSQAASYPPRTGCFSKKGLCSSGEGQLCTTREAFTRRRTLAPSTHFNMSSESSSIQEMERVGKQPCHMVSQSLASLSQSANKLKPRDEPEAIPSSPQTRRAKELSDSGHRPAGWQKEGDLGTHKAAKGAGCSSSHPHGPKQAAGHGKSAKTFWAESKPPAPSRASKGQRRVLAAMIRDITTKSSHFLHGSPLKRQHSAGDPDTMTSFTDSSPVVDHTREKGSDLLDADSSYSVDSLSCVYAKGLTGLLKPKDLQGKEWDLPEPEDNESDNSQISEDSLTEKGYQSPQDSLGDSYLTSRHGHSRARARASVRGFTTSSDRELFAQAHRSFSLDSLIDAEEELEEDQQTEPFFNSADEMPIETFWHLQTSSLPVVGQEAMCRLGPVTQRTGAMLDAILPKSSSFYLDSHPQPYCGQPESKVEASSSEQANTVQSMQVSRGSPLLSMDSWFSCDSKIDPSSSLGIVGSLCQSPNVQEFQLCGRERPGYWPNMEGIKPSSTEAVPPYTFKLPPGGAELPCSVRAVYTIPASDTSRLSFWGSYRFLQPGADGTFQDRGVPDTAQQDNSETSNNSSVSSVLAASASSFTHVGSTCERDWVALQQKYLLELSHPVLDAMREPKPAFSSLKEDYGSLTQASSEGRDTLLAVGSDISSSLNFNNFPIHISKIRHLRAEKEQDSLSVELEGTSDFFITGEKEVSYSGTYSADIESLTSGTTNVQVFVAENKVVNSVIEACGVKQNNFEEASQSSRREPGLMTSSDECFFLKNPCRSNVTIVTKEDHWPQGWAPLRKNSVGQAGQLNHNSHHPQQDEKADYQERSKEEDGRHPNLSFAFSSGPELYLHSAPWNSFPSSLQSPPLETFYVTKSRDALTETALEIPACREARMPTPPPREAWGLGHDCQVLQNVYWKNNLPMLLQKQDSKVASFEQVTAERPVDQNTKEVSGEIGKCPGDTDEESQNSVYFIVSRNRHFFTSTSTKVCEYENQVENLNKHSLPSLEEGEKTSIQSCFNVSSNSSGSGKPLVCEHEASGEEEQDQNAVLKQTQASNVNRQFPSGARSDFIYKTISLGLDKDMLQETTLSLKSSSAHCRVSSSEIMAQDGSPTHKGEGTNESGLPGKSLYPKDGSEEFKLPWTESTHGRFQSVLYSQEKNLTECKGPGKSQEMLNLEGPPPGKKQTKRFNSADEMARLIKSVIQLENGILEIESKQNKQLNASHTVGVSNEFVFQDQEMADHVLRSGSSGNHLSFKDQPSSLKQTDDAIFRDGKVGEMEVNSSIGEDPQVQKIILSPFKSGKWVQNIKYVSEHTPPAVLDRPTRNTWDYLGTCTTHSECTKTSANPRRTKALARAVPLQARPDWPFEKKSEWVHASASPRGQPCGWKSLEESQTVKDFQESQVAKHISSSNPEEPEVQCRVKEMTTQRGESLQEKYKMVSSTQKLLSPSQRCMDTFFSQETSPLLSRLDSSTAPHRDLCNTLSLNSLRLPRSYFCVPDAIGISSVDYVLDPTVLKMPDSPWVTEAGCQGYSGEPRSHSPQRNVRGCFSMAHTAWCGSAIFMAMGSQDQSSSPESISLGAEGRRSASTSPEDQGQDPRSTSMGLSTWVSSASKAKASVQTETKTASSLDRISSPLEKYTTCPLEEGNSQAREVKQKTEKEANDLCPMSAIFSAPVSLETPAHQSTGLAVLEEIRETKTHRKHLHNLMAEGTVLPYYETLLKSECSSKAPSRPQCQQMDQSMSEKTGNGGEAQGFHVASPSAEPGHQWTDKTTPLSADSVQPLPNAEVNKGPWQPSQTFSHADPALGKNHSGELRAGKQFICYCGPFEIIEEKKATGIPSDPVDSDSLPSSTAVEEDRRVIPDKVMAALSSQDLSDHGRVSQHEQSQLVPCETADGMLPVSQESSQAHQEPGTLDTTYEEGSGNFTLAEQGGKTTCFESQLVICDVHNSSFLSSNGLEEGRASPKQGAGLLGALSQQCVKESSVGSGVAEACRAGSKHPRPTSLPDQRYSPDPGGVREEALCRCPQEPSDCVVFSGSIDVKTLSPSGGQEDSKILPCQQLCNPQPISSHISSPSSTLLCYRDGDLGKGTSKGAPQALHPTCQVSCRACGVDERGESYSSESDMFLVHNLEPKGIHMNFEPTASSILEPSAAAAVLSLAQGCGSSSAPDMRTSSFSHSVAVGDPEKKLAENKASTELEAILSPKGVCSEPLGKFQDNSVGGQNAQASQTKPELPAATRRQHTLNLSEASVESKLLVKPQHGYLENAIRCLPEKPKLSTESRDHSGLDSQAKFIVKLKHTSSLQVGSFWEEEKQQREQDSSGSDDPVQGMCLPCSDEGGLDGCQIRDADRDEVAMANAHVSKTFSSGFKDSTSVPLEPTAQSPGQEQLAPCHRCSRPLIAICSGPKHCRSSLRPQFSVVSSSWSLQELNLSVEPPSPTAEETQEPNKLWNPYPRGHSSEKSVVGTSLKAEGYNHKASANLNISSPDDRPLQPASPPYPMSSAPLCIPTPDFMTRWRSDTVEQDQQEKPESLGGQAKPDRADKGVLHFGSGDINPCHLEGPAHIGWKQYVFGSAVDVSCSQTSQGLVPSQMAQCSSMDNGLEDRNSLFHSHLSTYANGQGLASRCSNIENARGSHEVWEVWDSSLALGSPHFMMDPEGAAPTKGPDKRAQFLSTPDEPSYLRNEPHLAEGSAAGPVDEIMLLYQSEAGGPVGQSRTNTLEQGTQTLGCSFHWSHTDISAHSETSTMPVCDLASWVSMHNLSLHLSQLLHSTSELLGNLSKPSVAGKEQNTKKETPDEAPQTLMIDSCTQTTMDEGIQTDLALPPVNLHAPEVIPEEVNVVLDVLDPDIFSMSQEKGHVPGTPQKREAKERAGKIAGLTDLQKESTPCRPQSPPEPSSLLRFQKATFGHNFHSVNPQASDASLPPGSQTEDPSCLAVSSIVSISHSPGPCLNAAESFGEPRVQKELFSSSALLVDRASSPILTVSASTQGSHFPLGSLSLSAPLVQPLEGHQKLVSSPDLPFDAPSPPVGNYSQTIDGSGGSQSMGAPCGEGRSSLERNEGRVSSPGSPQHSSKIQVHFLEQPYQQLQPQSTTWVQSRLLPLPLRNRSQRLTQGLVPEDVASLDWGPLSSRRLNKLQSKTENGGGSLAPPLEPQLTLDKLSSWGGLQHRSPCPVAELTDKTRLQGSTLDPTEDYQPQGLLSPSSQMCVAPEPQHHSLRDLPVHNKFSHWCGVRDGSTGELGVRELRGSRHDLSSGEQGQKPPDIQSQDAEWSQRKQIPLQVGAQNLSLSLELTEAKLHHGFGESDALLQVLQSGTGEALTAEEPVPSTWEELRARQKQTIETLRRQRAERLQNFHQVQSLSPQKQLSLLPNRNLPTRVLDLPSRRREYLQQLRKNVVETTRSPGSASRSAHPPSDIELMLQEYQRAREEAKVEIARARDRLRERTEQEKMRIRQQIVSQLLREEEKLQTLATSSSLCTSSNGSLSSGVTSGYNSSPALSGQRQSPDSVGDTNLPDPRDSWDVQGRSTMRNSYLNLAGSSWKSVAYSHRASLGSCCCSLSSMSSLRTCFSSSYQDLAKHIVDICMADVMAACSDDLHNLFSRQAAAGWNYQGEEQEVQLYYKVFSSTRHGFLGAGVVSQPLSHVWAAVSDPTLWPLYHKPIQTARLHQRVTKSINLVYLVCNPTLCALKQPRDFCCVCVEAKEVPALLVGHLSIMAAQSIYDTSMPRPSREMVRGEILPSAWILQPLIVEGKEITRVIYLAQIELGAPGFPPHLLSSVIKQQPLVIARLASFLGS